VTLAALTAALELAGLLLLVAAAALLVATWSLPGALATAGVGLIAVSGLLTVLSARRRRERT